MFKKYDRSDENTLAFMGFSLGASHLTEWLEAEEANLAQLKRVTEWFPADGRITIEKIRNRLFGTDSGIEWHIPDGIDNKGYCIGFTQTASGVLTALGEDAQAGDNFTVLKRLKLLGGIATGVCQAYQLGENLGYMTMQNEGKGLLESNYLIIPEGDNPITEQGAMSLAEYCELFLKYKKDPDAIEFLAETFSCEEFF